MYAAAMSSPSTDLPQHSAPEGKFLTLDPKSAVEVKYAEGIVDHRVELLHELGLANATIVETETSFAEEAARFLTNPVVISVFLTEASLGLIVDLYSLGLGVPGM